MESLMIKVLDDETKETSCIMKSNGDVMHVVTSDSDEIFDMIAAFLAYNFGGTIEL